MWSLITNNLIDDDIITNGNGFVQDSSLTILTPFSRKNIKEIIIKKNEETKNSNTQFYVANSPSSSTANSIQTAPPIIPQPSAQSNLDCPNTILTLWKIPQIQTQIRIQILIQQYLGL
jgi:hypothetical protein